MPNETAEKTVSAEEPVAWQYRSPASGEWLGLHTSLLGTAKDLNLEIRPLFATPYQAQKLAELVRDAGRYHKLRNDNAYTPEEKGVRGGVELDELCDALPIREVRL